jgi:Leucine-rich repeat (LRR) protein
MFLRQNKPFVTLAARIFGLILVYVVGTNTSVNAIILDRAELNKWEPNLLEKTRLDLNRRGIESIHVSTFTGLTSLAYLYLNNNQLSGHLDPSTFTGLIKLKELHYTCITIS